MSNIEVVLSGNKLILPANSQSGTLVIFLDQQISAAYQTPADDQLNCHQIDIHLGNYLLDLRQERSLRFSDILSQKALEDYFRRKFQVKDLIELSQLIQTAKSPYPQEFMRLLEVLTRQIFNLNQSFNFDRVIIGGRITELLVSPLFADFQRHFQSFFQKQSAVVVPSLEMFVAS